jgi:hypothetical protein
VSINLTRASDTGPEFSLGFISTNLSSGTVSANFVSFTFLFTENLTTNSQASTDVIVVYGVTAQVPVATLAGQWDGYVSYLATNTTCNAANHIFSFRRR